MLEIVLISIYGFAVLLVGYIGRKVKSNDDFVIGERKIEKLGTTASLFATITTQSLIFFSIALTLRYGPFGVLACIAGPSVGLLLMSFVAPRAHASGVDNRFVTIAEYCARKWGLLVGQFARLVFLFLLFWVVILQINLNGNLFAGILGWSPTVSTLVVVLVVALYLVMRGYRSVIKTDIFQGLLLLTFIVLPFFISPRPDVASALDAISWSPDVLLLFLMSFTMVITRPELWQRIYSAKTGRIASRALRWTSLLNLLIGLLVFYYALSVIQVQPNVPAMQAFSEGYREILPPFVAGFFPVLLLAAMMSSLDSAAFLLSVNITSLAVRFKARRIRWTRVFIVITLVLGGLLSLTVFDLLSFAYKINGLVALMMVPLVVSFWKTIPKGLLAIALLIGFVGYMTQIVLGRIDINPSEAIYPALGTGAVIMFGLVLYQIKVKFELRNAQKGV